MTTKEELPEGYFDQLADIGVIHQKEGNDGMLKIYLGNYWGRSTADHFLEIVRERGYESAYLTNIKLLPSETHALQFLALSKLDVQILPKEIHPHLLIIEKDGIYRLSLGLSPPSGQKFLALESLLKENGREKYWMRRLWRPNTVQMLADTEIIKTDESNRNSEKLPVIKNGSKAKLRPSKVPNDK
jgi:phosphorylcholine metabolism protein LicD